MSRGVRVRDPEIGGRENDRRGERIEHRREIRPGERRQVQQPVDRRGALEVREDQPGPLHLPFTDRARARVAAKGQGSNRAFVAGQAQGHHVDQPLRSRPFAEIPIGGAGVGTQALGIHPAQHRRLVHRLCIYPGEPAPLIEGGGGVAGHPVEIVRRNVAGHVEQRFARRHRLQAEGRQLEVERDPDLLDSDRPARGIDRRVVDQPDQFGKPARGEGKTHQRQIRTAPQQNELRIQEGQAFPRVGGRPRKDRPPGLRNASHRHADAPIQGRSYRRWSRRMKEGT